MARALMRLPCHDSAPSRWQRSSANMVHSSYDASSNVTTFPGHAILQSGQRGHHSLLGDNHKHIIWYSYIIVTWSIKFVFAHQKSCYIFIYRWQCFMLVMNSQSNILGDLYHMVTDFSVANASFCHMFTEKVLFLVGDKYMKGYIWGLINCPMSLVVRFVLADICTSRHMNSSHKGTCKISTCRHINSLPSISSGQICHYIPTLSWYLHTRICKRLVLKAKYHSLQVELIYLCINEWQFVNSILYF